MEQIFAFLIQLLEKHYKNYLVQKSVKDCQVCQDILNTFTAFVEWVAMSHIMANDKYLVRCLCTLLSDDQLQLNAAECLLGIVSWKSGKVQDRMQLLSLFSSEMIAPLFTATERANARALDEEHYTFLKKMVQILVELGGQLCVLWTKDGVMCGKDRRPENFDIYLNALLAFANHPSQTVNLFVNELWVKFFRHPDISKDEVFRTYIPKWMEYAAKKCARVGLPSREDHPSCAYSLLDFDTDEEFQVFFGKYRVIIIEGVKLISANGPALIPFQNVEMWIKQVLTNPINIGPENVQCTLNSPSYIELDAIANLFDAILSKLTPNQMEPVVLPAANLLQMVLDYQTQDPTLLSVLLSCVSSLFIVIGCVPSGKDTLLMPVLNKIFSSITFTLPESGNNKVKFSDPVKMLRRHGCALMVKLGTRQPEVLLPLFAHLRDTILRLRAEGQVLQLEFATLVEALVLISNEMKNFQAQSEFIQLISEPICAQLRNMEQAFMTPDAFINFIGLNKPLPPEGSENTPEIEHRIEMSFCLNFILSVCRRADCPSDYESCRNGGFILGQSEQEGTLALRNPAWPVAASVLRHFFLLTSTLNHMWSPDNIAKLHSDYAKALNMLESEKNSITGVGNRESNAEAKTRTPLSRVQTFLFETFENNYHFLSQLCISCGHEFYQTPQLAAGITEHVLKGADLIPDYRLRAIIRMFLKSLINKCPKATFSTVLAPVFQEICPYMLSRLQGRWKYLATLRETPGFDENNTDSQEVIDDVVCRHLAREYLDVVKAILTSGGGSDVSISSLKDDKNGAGSKAENNSDNNGESNGKPNQKLSELGTLVLGDDRLGQTVILTLLQALVWPDSPSSVRACTLLELVLPVLANSNLHDSQANQIMYSILSAFQELGQHETNYIHLTHIAIAAYEMLRPKHTSILQVLSQVPGCNPDDLKKFDDRMMSSLSGKENVKGGDRAKKDMFKKLISQIIGKDVAEMFKHEVVIKNLPTLQVRPKQKTPSLEETEKSDLGINNLFNGQRA